MKLFNIRNKKLLTFHNNQSLQEVRYQIDHLRTEEKNISFENKIIQLLHKIVEQNTSIMAHIKSFKSINKMETIQEKLYNRPEGLPLATVEEFKTFDSDIERLHILKQYLRFIGGIKLREALHRFQKKKR